VIRKVQEKLICYFLTKRFKLSSLRRFPPHTIPHTEGVRIWQLPCSKRLELIEEVAKLQYNWSLKYKDYTDGAWDKIIWSYECSVELGSGHHHKYVSRLNLHGGKWKKVYHIRRVNLFQVMVWAAIWGKIRSDLVRLERNLRLKSRAILQSLI
jgi:hypothetical protein